MIDIVSATRLSEDDFWNRSPLGISLKRLAHDRRLAGHITFDNENGLPEVYNARLAASDCGDIIVFIHDDVWIDDYFLAGRVVEGLQHYDVIGVAGNKKRHPYQPGWAFSDIRFTWDVVNLSGSVAHGDHPFGKVSFYGSVPTDCQLLDGVFLAVEVSALRKAGVHFDPKFRFNFYDMDFCRMACCNGMKLGTWPICLTHRSKGVYGNQEWEADYRRYIAKWGD